MSMQKHATVREGDDTTFASLNYRPINTAVSMKSTDGLIQLKYNFLFEIYIYILRILND